jgi:protein-disulfide isomerase
MTIASRAALALAALVALGGCSKVDAAVDGRIHSYLMRHPEVVIEAADRYQQNEKLAAEKAATQAIGQFRPRLERDPRDFVANPNGKVTVVEFFDYRCGYCKLAAPEVLQLIQQNPDVRFVFKEFPIFGEVSDTAARIALTPQAKGKGLQLYQSWMAEKALDEEAIDRDLRSAGLDPAELRKAAATPEIQRQILDTRVLAQSLKILGTPTFIVGETLVPGADMTALRAAITQAKATNLKKPA